MPGQPSMQRAQPVFSRALIAFGALLLCHSVAAKTVEVYLEVKWQYKSPVCIQQLVGTINNEVIGPTIEADVGDTVRVTTVNKMHDGTAISIHYHGITQNGTPYSDGVGTIACSIAMGETRVDEWEAEQAGTFWYHSHVGAQRATIYGSIVVHGRDVVETYDEEFPPMAIMDYLPFVSNAEKTVIGTNNGLWGDGDFSPDTPQSLVAKNTTGYPDLPLPTKNRNPVFAINGRGALPQFTPTCAAMGLSSPFQEQLQPCDLAACGDGAGKEVFNVEAGLSYRMRIVAAMFMTEGFIFFAIEKHDFKVVAVDGQPVKPFTVTSLALMGGETYDIILDADQPVANYWLTITGAGPPSGWTLHYRTAPDAAPQTSFPFPAGTDGAGQADLIKALDAQTVPAATKEYTLTVQPLLHSATFKLWTINNVINNFAKQVADPTLLSHYYGTLEDQPLVRYEDSNLSYPTSVTQEELAEETQVGVHVIDDIDVGDVVQFVMINGWDTDSPTANQFHPIHMHGYWYWLLASGTGEYDPQAVTLNTVDPPLRHSAILPSKGWMVGRFVVDNPGAWLMHCHIATHNDAGFSLSWLMGMDDAKKPSEDEKICGSITAATVVKKMLQDNEIVIRNRYRKVNQAANACGPLLECTTNDECPAAFYCGKKNRCTACRVCWLDTPNKCPSRCSGFTNEPADNP